MLAMGDDAMKRDSETVKQLFKLALEKAEIKIDPALGLIEGIKQHRQEANQP